MPVLLISTPLHPAPPHPGLQYRQDTDATGHYVVLSLRRCSTPPLFSVSLPPLMLYTLFFLLVFAARVRGVPMEYTGALTQEEVTPYSHVLPSQSPPPAVLPQESLGREGESLANTLIQLLRRAATAAQVVVCPYPYTQVIHECFYMHKKKLTWPQARRVCQGMSGELAEPRHIYALQTHMADVYGPGYFWVGATREDAADNEWRWLSGRPLDPEDWLFQRPDNQNGDERCLEMVMSDYPKVFNDETCGLAQRFICQYRAE
ncbi:CD209 antigen-like isoform X2 [Portunus trituberculatus]|uniref:CD209 antigen-like isoform X2 n=1 Tax=Portunus trituberculatus TaxID=210409 RepID=UPI001E1CC080|nr:CD209 antigen-like isoform X2 [Portunus trituberculatus]